MLWIFLGACAPNAGGGAVPTDGAPAWRDDALASCVVTEFSGWEGGNSENSWVDTYDADGQKVSSVEDSGADGTDDLSWTHTWSGEVVDTTGESVISGTDFTDVEHREFDGPRILRAEIDSDWFQYDFGVITRGATVTTWDGDLPTREDYYSDPAGTDQVGGADWVWADDLSSVAITRDDGTTLTRQYDADLHLVTELDDPVAGGSQYTVRTDWTWGERGPLEMTYDNDEDGVLEATTTWTYDCP